jgi:uncharacterized protein with von Willebrand factor type A (vWA) domain
MTTDDLYDLLDLGGTDAAPASNLEVTSETQDQGDAPEASPQSLQLDAWGVAKGARLLDESERLHELKLGSAEGAASAIADFHGAAFEFEPQMTEACVDAERHEFIRQLLDTPEYAALHNSTCLETIASEIAAVAFAEQFAALHPRDENDTPTGTGTGDGKEGIKKDMAVLGAVGAALAQASEQVGEFKEACAAFGLGEGAPGGTMDAKRSLELYRRVRNNPTLKKISELAGRFRRFAQARQRQKATHGYDDMVGVVQDGDVGRLLPVELAQIADPDLELDALRRLVERQTLCREHKGTEPVAKGPVIICVDESGSMDEYAGGVKKIIAAKALALALAYIARSQKRWCALVAYSGSSGERLLPLPPSKWDEAALLDWLTQFIGRGSDLDVPLRELPKYHAERLGAPRGKTDIVLVTDGIVRVDEGLKQGFLSWKAQSKAKLYTLLIGGSGLGDLQTLSDESWQVGRLDLDQEGVQQVLSI